MGYPNNPWQRGWVMPNVAEMLVDASQQPVDCHHPGTRQRCGDARQSSTVFGQHRAPPINVLACKQFRQRKRSGIQKIRV